MAKRKHLSNPRSKIHRVSKGPSLEAATRALLVGQTYLPSLVRPQGDWGDQRRKVTLPRVRFLEADFDRPVEGRWAELGRCELPDAKPVNGRRPYLRRRTG